MIAEALLWFKVLGKSDSVINHAQNHFLPDSLQPHHDLPRLSVFIGINDCFPSDAVEMGGSGIVLDTK